MRYALKKHQHYFLFIMDSWTTQLPHELQQQINAVVQAHPPAMEVFTSVYNHLSPSPKKRKVSPKQEPVESITPAPKQEPTEITPPKNPDISGSKYNIKLETQIEKSTTIFELSQISFISPARRRLNFVFHLLIENNVPIPVLSIVNPKTNLSELSYVHLQQAVKLCVVLPILGNSLINSKKDTVQLCFWLDDEEENTPEGVNPVKIEPIICQFNLDALKKQLYKDGKISPAIEQQLGNETSDDDDPSKKGIKPINEVVIDFLQKQFKLCGVNLISYLPSNKPDRNHLSLNTDNGVALSMQANSINDIVVVSAYKGSKEGSLIFLAANKVNPAYMIFGFKKPILLFQLSKIKHISYHNITRITFSILVTFENEAKAGKEEVFEFGMIDQAYFEVLDTFIKAQNINDNSFDEQYREKPAQGQEEATTEEQAPEAADSDDEEEDGTYNGGAEEEEESGSGSGEDDFSGSGSDSEGDMLEEGEEEEEEEEEEEKEENKDS